MQPVQKPISPEQCRAGRAILGWSREELARRSKISERTLVDFEREARNPIPVTLASIEAALEAGGVELVHENGGGPGVRRKRGKRK